MSSRIVYTCQRHNRTTQALCRTLDEALQRARDDIERGKTPVSIQDLGAGVLYDGENLLLAMGTRETFSVSISLEQPCLTRNMQPANI